MKIALVIPGRFHGFDLARALLARGHDVTVFTNYPRWATRRFGLPDDRVRSFAVQGALTRLAARLPGAWIARRLEAPLHRLLGRWAERALRDERWDVIHGWSGVSEELLRSPRVVRGATVLMRGSAHILEQSRLLEDEEARARTPLDRPSPWMIARELREYELADRIMVLSTFSLESFTRRGVPRERLAMVPLGVEVSAFRPSVAVLADRRRRILGGERLRALYVGAVSLRKGALDFAEAIERLEGTAIDFTFVGPILPEARAVVDRLRGRAAFAGKLPQHELPRQYWSADLFVFPTIEDGFPTVLAQAKAAGLPIVTTRHGAGVDIVRDGRDGWLVPVRDGRALADRLAALAADRAGLADMAEAVAATFQPRDWSDVAREFDEVCRALSDGRHAEGRDV